MQIWDWNRVSRNINDKNSREKSLNLDLYFNLPLVTFMFFFKYKERWTRFVASFFVDFLVMLIFLLKLKRRPKTVHLLIAPNTIKMNSLKNPLCLKSRFFTQIIFPIFSYYYRDCNFFFMYIKTSERIYANPLKTCVYLVGKNVITVSG